MISIPVDATNPGQFFACCGLFELADRLWPGAESWFGNDSTEFHISCAGNYTAVLRALVDGEIRSSLSPQQLKRLGTLLSAAKAKLSPADLAEKSVLQEMWKRERLYLPTPFDLGLDWWRDSHGERTDLKTWAAKQLVADMAVQMLNVIRTQVDSVSDESPSLLSRTQHDSLPFYFDSDLSKSGTARDAGFSSDTLNLKACFRPQLEFLAFVGMQRFQPSADALSESFSYATWGTPVSPQIASVAAALVIPQLIRHRFRFCLFARTKYMKSFLPAQPF